MSPMALLFDWVEIYAPRQLQAFNARGFFHALTPAGMVLLPTPKRESRRVR